jgi:hypothetical protein
VGGEREMGRGIGRDEELEMKNSKKMKLLKLLNICVY